MNDSNALLLLDYLQSKNIRVPEDIQIIGYDGFRYFENFETSLTSIKQPIQQMAEAAFDLLFRLIAGEEIGNPIVLPVQFKEGKTTKKFPSTD